VARLSRLGRHLAFDTGLDLLYASPIGGPMRLPRIALAVTFTLACAAPAAAQRYTAKQDGDVIELADATAQMNVSVVWSMSNAYRIQVKGKDLVRAAASLADFEARPGLSGIPLLAPFANRLDETALYANGKKYNFDLELGNVRGPIPGTGYVNGSKAWQLVEFKADSKSAWVTCRLDFYKIPQFMKQFPFAHTITMTYRVADGALEVHTRLDNLSNEPMPVVVGYHPIYELPDGNRDDWTVSVDAKTHWIEIPQRLPTGETQPIENFFGGDRQAIQLKKYALIDDVFTDLIRDANGRATMKLMYNGKELDEILGPKFHTVLLWSTPLAGGGGRGGGQGGPGGARAGGGGPGGPGGAGGGRAAGGGPGAAAPAPSGPFPVDPAQGVRVAPPAVVPAAGAPAPAAGAPQNKGFIAFEPMVAITNALNLAQKGVYKDLQSIAPGGFWEESFWITTKGY
jgi:aldose 1-epimerase